MVTSICRLDSFQEELDSSLERQENRLCLLNPQDFYTNSFFDELEQTGFMRELAARYPDALR
ncbi:MAG: hypothetical protein ACREQA_03455 [Candidatus Binatia bacterium]